MTENEIIKFIEHAISSAKSEDSFKEIYWEKLEYILDLINRQKEKIKEFDEKLVIQQGLIDYQQAEIERLKGSVITNNIVETQRIKREAKLEVINEFEKEIKYVKENEKYDDFNPIVDIDLCENVLNIMKLQNEKIKKLNIKNKKLSILINMQEKNIREQQVIIDKLSILNKSATSEAIKEFAERLKEHRYGELNNCISFSVGYLDNLVKEMTGVSE